MKGPFATYPVAGRVPLITLTAAAALLGGCAGTYESAVRYDIDAVRAQHDWSVDTGGNGTRPSRAQADSLSTGISAYVALALQNNPEIRAAFERWQASVHRISRARRLPEPTVGFGYFIQSVETRVGPQQARISLQQAFPWPTKLTAGADAASAQARSIQRRFEAQSLMITQRVATAYWSLWQIRSTRSIHQQHLEVVRGLSESVRARISTGTAMLADLQQIDLTAARLEDNIRGMDEAERVAEAQLRAAIGVRGDLVVPTDQPPSDPVSPSEGVEALAAAAQEHPMITSLGFMAEAAESSARAEAADRYPSFTVGADWIITGDAAMPGVADSGKDAVIVGAGIRIPLWQGSYSDSIAAARADARAQRADQRALADRAAAELTTSLSNVEDAVRRAALYRGTLVPQAESAYDSVLGAYTVGRGTVAQTLLAQRDLLELRVELDRARADYERAWARLEEITGREVRRTPVAPEGASTAEVTDE